ncbi:MAG: DUF523 domain-containing protein [Sutterella sp.]|uniref:DUF523 domain-containing protein n=1 Tax=Dakarella massiliensis TaxID=1506471 RepID=UPI000336C73B|nr:DUF523 domain-containing protein [Dakarella massiliensis]MBS6156503.1 DUF523 domain-containing protein [Sutterella sp.]CDE51538.1 putative uncharacterized protein [Sutterella sp. CAG:351]
MASPIFVSACLLGFPVRWDGKTVSGDYASILTKFVSRGGRIVSLCPECPGGLPTPRPPCEIQAGDGADVLSGRARVISVKRTDQTLAYLQGAREALALCLQNQVKVAVLKSFSPACGNGKIYDGFFRGTKKDGTGVTASLLSQSGIRVFDAEHTLEAVALALKESSDESCGCGRE